MAIIFTFTRVDFIFYSNLLQFWGAEKETQQQRLETAIFEDLNRYCWNQQSSSGSNNSGNSTANISISTATSNSSGNGNSTTSGPQLLNSTDGQVLIYNNRLE